MHCGPWFPLVLYSAYLIRGHLEFLLEIVSTVRLAYTITLSGSLSDPNVAPCRSLTLQHKPNLAGI